MSVFKGVTLWAPRDGVPLLYETLAYKDAPPGSVAGLIVQLGGAVIDTPARPADSQTALAPPPPGITHVAAWHATDPAARAASTLPSPPALVSPVWAWQCASSRRSVPYSSDPVYRPLAFPTIAGARECEVTVSGFVGDLRAVVLAALEATGVVATKAMSTATATHVVAPDVDDASSAKIARAKSPTCASRIAVVNPGWLWDSLRRGRAMPTSPYVYNLLHGPEPLDGLEFVSGSAEEEPAAGGAAAEGQAAVPVPALNAAGTKRVAAPPPPPAEARRLRFTQLSTGEGTEGGTGAGGGGGPDENAQPPGAPPNPKAGGTGLKGGAPPAGTLPPSASPPTETQTRAALGAAGGFASQLAAPTQAAPGAWAAARRGRGVAGGAPAAAPPPPPPPFEAAPAAEAGTAAPAAAAPAPGPDMAPTLTAPRAPAAPGEGAEGRRAVPRRAQPIAGARALARRGRAPGEAGPARGLRARRAPSPCPPPPPARRFVAVGGLHTAEASAAVSTLRRLGVSAEGGAAAARWRRGTTHLVEPRLRRTAKTLAAMAAGAWVLGTSWVEACAAAGKAVGEEGDELLSGAGPSIAPRAARHWRERAAASGGGAFAGLRFAVLPGLAPPGARPDRDDLCRILEAGGGVVVPAGAAASAPPDLAVVPPGTVIEDQAPARRRGSAPAAPTDPRVLALAAAGVPCASPAFIVDWLSHPSSSAATLAKAHLVKGSPGLGALLAETADGRGRVRGGGPP